MTFLPTAQSTSLSVPSHARLLKMTTGDFPGDWEIDDRCRTLPRADAHTVMKGTWTSTQSASLGLARWITAAQDHLDGRACPGRLRAVSARRAADLVTAEMWKRLVPTGVLVKRLVTLSFWIDQLVFYLLLTFLFGCHEAHPQARSNADGDGGDDGWLRLRVKGRLQVHASLRSTISLPRNLVPARQVGRRRYGRPRRSRSGTVRLLRHTSVRRPLATTCSILCSFLGYVYSRRCARRPADGAETDNKGSGIVSSKRPIRNTASGAPRMTAAMLCILMLIMTMVVNITVPFSVCRIGEADNPGPLHTDFDDPEPIHWQIDEELDAADGEVGQVDLGFAEVGFDNVVSATAASAAHAGHMLNLDGDSAFGLDWSEGLTSIDDLDDAALAALGLLGPTQESARGPTLRHDILDETTLQTGPLTQEEQDAVNDARGHVGVRLPEDMFGTLQRQDAHDAHVRHSRWKEVLGRAQAARAARIARTRAAPRDVVMAAAPTVGEPVIEEMVLDDVIPEHGGGAPAEGDAIPEERECVPREGRPPYPRRARGRRQRGRKGCELWSLNSSGRPQLEGALRIAGDRTSGVVALLNQEHHQTADRKSDLQAFCRRIGWTAVVTPAVPGKGEGPTAGTAVVTPRHVPIGIQDGMDTDPSPPEARGRIACSWIQAVVPCGFMAVSAYFFHSEGGTYRNVKVLCHALRVGRASRCPWVIAADCQQSPKEFLSWAGGAITKAGGTLVAAGEPTHYASVGEAREIDYFVISDALASYVDGARVVYEAAANPHRAVALRFKASSAPPHTMAIACPGALPEYQAYRLRTSTCCPLRGKGTCQRRRR